MDFDFPAFTLRLTRDPFAFTLLRGETLLFACDPYPEPVLDWQEDGQTVRIGFPSATLELAVREDGVTVRWAPGASGSPSIRQSFPLIGYWYGQGEFIHQLWPLNRFMLWEDDLISIDNGPTGLLNIQTPAWLTSQGVGVLAHSQVRVGLNQPPASYPRYVWDVGPGQAPFDQRPPADPGGLGDSKLTLSDPNLHYEILVAADLPSVFQLLVARLGHPVRTPPAGLFTRPTWTTWARYKSDVSQTVVLSFAHEILDHGYPYSVFEIDDRWQVYYGDLSFDSVRFPDPRGMVEELHRLGFKVTAWVIPFLEPASAAFVEGTARGYLVNNPAGQPYLVPWWQGQGGLLDVTNPAALDWFLARLRALQAETGLDGFKFDAGEAIFLPVDAVVASPGHRNDYTHRYVEFAARSFNYTEVRPGWLNQAAPIFFRQWDKTTKWGHANGLRSVIPGLLSLGLAGYPYILPDMVGGNAYGDVADAELMIRWAQLSALLPAVQFSLAPWSYGEECDSLCRRYAELHLEFAPVILQLAQEAARTGQPIIRSLAWLAPHDERALLCDDEFLLGNDILVAPVVHPGQRARDIYLPPGSWRDHPTGQVVEGPLVLKDVPAPLDVLPVFQRYSAQPNSRTENQA
jgi:alpha-glucosidase (family GH31 glycosyl hydrolase)